MCPRYSRSPCGILHLGAPQHLVANPAVEKLGRDEIDTPAVEKSRKLILEPDEPETRYMPGLELYEDVDIALRTEVFPQNGAEEREPPDVIAPAEFGEQRLRDLGSHSSELEQRIKRRPRI